MKAVISITILSLLLSLNVVAQNKNKQTQNKPSINGVWILEKIEDYSLVDMNDYENYVLNISSTESKVKIKKTYVFKGQLVDMELTLFINGQGEKNTVSWSERKDVEENSKTQINKNKIKRNYNFKVELNGKEESFRGVEKYYLSKDENKLIFEQNQTLPIIPIKGINKNKFIFRRKDNEE